MIIEVPQLKKIVQDYDIVFESGMIMPITIDKAQGDTIHIAPDHIQISLTAKPSLNDPNKLLPAEEITIFVSKVASVQKRDREVIEQTTDQKKEWQKTFADLTSSTIQ